MLTSLSQWPPWFGVEIDLPLRRVESGVAHFTVLASRGGGCEGLARWKEEREREKREVRVGLGWVLTSCYDDVGLEIGPSNGRSWEPWEPR